MKYLSIIFIVIAGINCSHRFSPDANWGRQRWVVTEMKGIPVQLSGSRRDAFINFRTDERRFSGNGGCNQISGNYTLDKQSMHFGEIISTKMSCEDNAFENTFLDLLNKVDRFEQKGDNLLLKRKREVLLVLRSR
jgi:heat shock protein HslJ